MAATMKWKVENLVYYPTKDGKSQVVYEVSWRCNGTEEKDGETYSSSAAGNNIIAYDADASFTAFDDLTEEQVLGWIWETDVVKVDVEANVQASVDEHITPTSVVGVPSKWSE
jgi:hypothetical protein